MISCDFAPNEQLDDAFLSLKLLFQPWRWHNGKELEKVKKYIFSQLLITNYACLPARQGLRIFFFLTGRTALYYLLKILNLPKNSEIIVQGFTCEAVVLPILANNLRPIYADIETASFSIDPIELDRKIGPKTKAIILQHSFGIRPKHREKIMSIAKLHNLLLIEDIAHGFQSQKLKGKRQKLIYLLSFGRSKAISSVFGGAIVTNDNLIASKLKSIEKNLQKPGLWFVFRILIYKPLSVFIKLTYDFWLGKIIHKLSNWLVVLPAEITQKEKKGEYNHFFDKAYPNALAILLLHQLKKFDQIQQKRAKISSIYNKFITHKSFFLNHSLSRYPILAKNRSQLITKARKQNVFLGNWYSQPVGPSDLNLNKVQYKLGSCPVSEKVCQEIINLPTNIRVNEAIKITQLWK